MQLDFPDPFTAPDDEDLIAIGQFDIEGQLIAINRENVELAWPKQTVDGSTWDPQVIIWAYRHGLFPMPLDAKENPLVISWWSPNPRGVLELGNLRVSKSLRKSLEKYRCTMDQAFEQVMRSCGDPSRPSGWITEPVVGAYKKLHDQGFAHSVEVWDESGELVGGLYGLEIGGLFAGESMFHTKPDASKVALVHLVSLLEQGESNSGQPRLVDCQWQTEHLASLGVTEISRVNYLARLPKILETGPALRA